jgi:hypothetical protein
MTPITESWLDRIAYRLLVLLLPDRCLTLGEGRRHKGLGKR